MQGIILFLDKIKKRPLQTISDLARDYTNFTGLCFFFLILILYKKPFRFIEERSGIKVRDKFIDLIARIAGA
jgi:hypothetical protein